jgi:hypothetical protein
VVTGDFNGDGWQDLAFTDGGMIAILLNQGDSGQSNQPPVADGGMDAAAECTSPAGALLTLDGSASSDPDSSPGTNDDIVLFEWYEDFGTASEVLLGSGESLTVTMPLGDHLITLRVTDNAGETDTDTVQLAVVDTTPPEITVDVTPSYLRPPNHKLVDVYATVTATDICSEPVIVLASVTSSEPDDAWGGGDGHTLDDIQEAEVGAPDFDVKLRAERAASGDDRTYTLVYTATDGAGNESSAEAVVLVPHH